MNTPKLFTPYSAHLTPVYRKQKYIHPEKMSEIIAEISSNCYPEPKTLSASATLSTSPLSFYTLPLYNMISIIIKS